MNKLYIRLRCCFVLLLPAALCKAQNLVPNASFENGTCVVNYNSTPQKVPTTINDWYSCTGASPDPFDVCGSALPAAYDVFVPDVLYGYQYARTGKRFMGFGFYNAPWYEYIGTKLTSPHETGNNITSHRPVSNTLRICLMSLPMPIRRVFFMKAPILYWPYRDLFRLYKVMLTRGGQSNIAAYRCTTW